MIAKIRRFLATLKAWDWWKKNHTERVYTLMSKEEARGVIWIIFETENERVNYAVMPESQDLRVTLQHLMWKARRRLKEAQAEERSGS